jgi:amidase
VSRPTPEDNPFNAWATKVIVENVNEEERSLGLLAGKRVILKDNICLAGIPCEFGTKVFENWVPETDATVVKRVLEAGGTVSSFPLPPSVALLTFLFKDYRESDV